jgi:hypothetical protein
MPKIAKIRFWANILLNILNTEINDFEIFLDISPKGGGGRRHKGLFNSHLQSNRVPNKLEESTTGKFKKRRNLNC